MLNVLTEGNFITNGLSCLLMVVKIVLEAGMLVFDFLLFFVGGGGGARVGSAENKIVRSSIFERPTSIRIRILLS